MSCCHGNGGDGGDGFNLHIVNKYRSSSLRLVRRSHLKKMSSIRPALQPTTRFFPNLDIPFNLDSDGQVIKEDFGLQMLFVSDTFMNDECNFVEVMAYLIRPFLRMRGTMENRRYGHTYNTSINIRPDLVLQKPKKLKTRLELAMRGTRATTVCSLRTFQRRLILQDKIYAQYLI